MADRFVLRLEVERIHVRSASVRESAEKIHFCNIDTCYIGTERAIRCNAMGQPRIYRITVRLAAGSDVVQDVGGSSIREARRPNNGTWIKEAAGTYLCGIWCVLASVLKHISIVAVVKHTKAAAKDNFVVIFYGRPGKPYTRTEIVVVPL